MRALHRKLGLVAVSLAVACGAEPKVASAPLDRFIYPVGMAVHDGRLVVVSSNFDLRYNVEDGGSVLQVDPGTTPATFLPDGVRIGSFGGEIAVVDDAAQCGLPGPTAFVTSRLGNTLYRIGFDGSDALQCGAGCAVPVEAGSVTNPYGVAVTCPTGGPARAWVGYLNAPNGEGWVGALDLQSGALKLVDVGVGVPRTFAYDPARARLFFTSTSTGAAAPLRWLELGGGCTPGAAETAGGCPVRQADLSSYVTGAELAGVALAHPLAGQPLRVYVSAHLYDATLAATIGVRPAFDIGGLLFVLDLIEGPAGDLQVKLVRSLDIGLGAAEVRVLPQRPGKRDLVAITATEDGLLWIYDDDTGTMASVLGRDPRTGEPVLGRSPFGLAVEDRGSTARVYVGSFLRGYVTPVDVPLDEPWKTTWVPDPASPTTPLRIGKVMP